MRLDSKWRAFLAFAALFAAGAGFVFWGSWSMGMVPVMPDCPTSFPADYAEDWLRGWAQDGKFVPGDVIAFLGSPYFWLELKYALAAFAAALGLAYFLRGRGLSRLASYGAGLFLGFSGYWFTLFSAGHLGWFRWMTYGVFAFGLIDRALAKGKLRHWVGLGACLAWGSFYQSDLWLLFTVFTFAYFLYRFISLARAAEGEGVKTWLPAKWLKGGAIALAAFALIGYPSFKNAIVKDLAGRDAQIEKGETVAGDVKDDAEKRWLFVTNWSMPPEDTLEFIWPRIHGDTSCPLTLAIGEGSGIKPYTGRLGRPKGAQSGNYRQHSLYVGFITCILALAGLIAFRKRGDVKFFFAAGIVFWLFSMGRFCEPVYRLVYSLPMGDYLRAPVKWHHLTEFSIAVLAGFGLEFVASRFKRSYLAAALILAGVADLAWHDSLYCAPHRADTELLPILSAMEKRARDAGYAILGRAEIEGMTPFVLAERKAPRPKVRASGMPMDDATYIMAILSALASGAAMGLILLGAISRKADGKLKVS